MLHPCVENGTGEDGGNGRSAATADAGLARIAVRKNKCTYVLMISWNSQTPSMDAATPRTAEDTICVMGEVTLMDSKLAMLIKKPNMPYHGSNQSRYIEKR